MQARQFKTWYTACPVAYDYENSTHYVEDVGTWDGMSGPVPIRMVKVLADRAEFQRGRYESSTDPTWFDLRTLQEHANLKSTGVKLMNAMERTKERDRRGNEKWAKIRDHARDQGLILVQVSPRKYQVLRMKSSCGLGRDMNTGRFFTKMEAEVVHNGNYESCMDYIEKNGEPVPEALTVDGNS